MSPGELLYERLRASLGAIRGRIAIDSPMHKLTWFRVGGPADILFQPADEADLAAFMQFLPDGIPVTVVGVGSNLLVRDGGIEGVVIRLSARGFGQIERAGETQLVAGAAVSDKKLAAFALEAGLGGFAFYHGIPGGIGGALRMNAGANGAETVQRVVEVRALDRRGEAIVLDLNAMGYGYRKSEAPDHLVFVSALFQGVIADKGQIEAEMETVASHRKAVQPIREKTGGSTFKNPPGHSAWKLVDEAGLRGMVVGDAQMSEMHCNFMINRGSATAFDLERLAESVRVRVKENSGIALDWEIRRIGRFEPGKNVEPAF